MMHPFTAREEYWGYLATFLNTTLHAPVRKPYLDLDTVLKGKDFFILTTNQDTQFVKLYSGGKGQRDTGRPSFLPVFKMLL